jgi:hypothetical protein
MRTLVGSLLLIISTVGLFGCVTASVHSNQSATFSGPYKRLFILVHNSSRSKIFMDGFVDRTRQELAKRNVDVEFYVHNELSLDSEADINAKVKDFKADAIMMITQTESMIYGGVGLGSSTGSNSGTFDLRLYDHTPDKIIWRATMKAYGDYGISMAVGKASKEFISKLEQDRVI